MNAQSFHPGGSHSAPTALPGNFIARRPLTRLVGLAALIALTMSTVGASAPTVTTATLLREMTDLAGMAEFPEPAYTCRQFSSYDRKSKSPKEDWFANGDSGNYLRVEEREGRREFVMMDAEGPGAVVRIWSANPEGTLRVYVDGESVPVIEAPMKDLLGGRVKQLPLPIAGEYSKGWNLYLPIPYARHCKITSDRGGFYYHVNYRTYVPGAAVESFTATTLESLADKLAQVVRQLDTPATVVDSSGASTEPFQFDLPPGGTIRHELQGPGAIQKTWVRMDAVDLEATLRGIVLRVVFDGENCIEAPLGDFYGSAPGINAYASLPLSVTKEGRMECRWYMPYRQGAVIELVNLTDKPASFTGEISTQPYRWTDRSMHFHAKWQTQFDVPSRPMIDWNYLTAKGQGVFAGVAFAIDNPVRQWWGEGDEKIYVDGETFPSHFGTGTEDYYGYAWCWPGTFTHAYHAQPRCDGPGNYGRTSVNRFHILDRIPFQRDFRFDMELWHWSENCRVNMAVVAYWYAGPGGSDAFARIQPADAVVRPMPEYVAPRVPGAIEGEDLHVVSVVGTVEPQDWDNVSGDRHLWWHTGMQPGDALALEFQAPSAGKYRVFANFLTARDYGIHQLSINGQKAGGPRDFYNQSVRATGETELGTFDLKEGVNTLAVTVTGKHPDAIPAYMFGLDYLLLKPVE